MGRVAISASVAAVPTLLWWFVALDFSSPWVDGFSRLFWFAATAYCFAAAYWLVGQSTR